MLVGALGAGSTTLLGALDAPVAPAAAAAPAAAIRAAPPAPAPVVGPADRARCPATSVACVDLETRTAWLQRDGAVVLGPVPMLAGADTGLRPPGPNSSATPAGRFAVLRKKADEWSTEFDEPMPDAVYFAPGGIAFHEGSLTQSSNGCVHLAAPDARAFFDRLSVGDGVSVF